uniref:Checkpoint protein n=1 Tax=Calcidiscus leptoporus TaxID=127549 RepID=A0A7S0NX83_9EUKA|mmetsp:Transcript_32112/g.74834  ORF Transcript_32112/g.74834 Transcript_32112/m.74834 type:complete len:305 (+) Transcript_32112:58-972(+)|eukprot:CAMPEP_0119361408 /NCGR_PEP_ID=MMETSP1334-20130426/8725_1 /TAXON_ID=127549 /ORGANISM="Calcidiscus leptoporus, Strain RCC1130" /LENGTH=304 /DNA_ID=CAMNT_0007376413 /DNA_START=53 /DNA_END=967 /DNA_ORIENTATION=-
MKFRATFGSAAQLSKLVLMLDKLADSCVVHLTADQVCFSLPPSASGGVQVAAELAQRSIFLDHRIESRAANNRISFFVKLNNLARALRSCSGTQSERVQVKLTKKMNGQPTLTFEIQLSDSQVQVLHDVPIRIVQDSSELHAYAEPQYSAGDDAVSVVLPQQDVRGLRNVVERMRIFSEYVLLTATDGTAATAGGAHKSAMLRLEVEKDNLVAISTTYRDLERVQLAEERDDDPARDAPIACAKVEIKRLARALQSLVASDIKMHSAICCILPDAALILKVFLPSVDDRHQQASFVVFYFPVQL